MNNWKPITQEMRKGGPWLVTNNPGARNVYGGMSHVWVVSGIFEGNGEFVAFDGHRKIYGLKLYAPIFPPESLRPIEERSDDPAAGNPQQVPDTTKTEEAIAKAMPR